MINIYFLIISFKLSNKNFQEHRIHGFPIVLINYGHTLDECKLESVIVGVTMVIFARGIYYIMFTYLWRIT